MLRPLLSILALLTAHGCVLAVSDHDDHQPNRAADIEHGQYLVSLLGCGRCHTQGYLTGNTATGPYLAGSTLGIAWTAYDDSGEPPGLAFPPNLTPDPDTGLGAWSEAEIIRTLRAGVGRDGHQRLPVMPWGNYAALTDDDVRAVARYLQSLTPVRRQIPARTERGEHSDYPFVRFGVYTFEPRGSVERRDMP